MRPPLSNLSRWGIKFLELRCEWFVVSLGSWNLTKIQIFFLSEILDYSENLNLERERNFIEIENKFQLNSVEWDKIKYSNN